MEIDDRREERPAPSEPSSRYIRPRAPNYHAHDSNGYSDRGNRYDSRRDGGRYRDDRGLYSDRMMGVRRY